MKRPILRACQAVVSLVTLLLAAAIQSTAAQEGDKGGSADFFVSPNGADKNPGTLTEPFATLARARNAVRELKRRSGKKDLVVQIRGGTYRLNETLVFSLEDSAYEDGTITYAAYANEKPIFSSGVPIRNWQKLKNMPANASAAARGKLWVADLPSELEKVLTLYDGRERLPRARGKGFSPAESADKKYTPDRITFPAGAIRNWSDLKDAELLVIPSADYEMCLLPLKSVNEKAHTAITTVPASRPIGKVKFVPVSAWVENALEVLDEPGEWVVNTVERKLYFWPRAQAPGENIVAPKFSELVRVEGRIDYDGSKDEPVRGLVFRGLSFRHAERYPWHGDTGWGLQHHWEMFDRPTAAFRLRGVEDCVVQACQFTATSGAGLRLDLHCQKNRIVDNEIGHVGGVGILLAGYGPGTKDANRQNEVSQNWIHHTGEIYWATPAVMIWQSGENHIANNLIHHTPYSGITVSTRTTWNPANTTDDGALTLRWREMGDPDQLSDWKARERFLHARKNLIEQNDLHHVMEVMGDGDGIYVSGTGGGNRLRHNYIHDSDSDGMADGIRCDDDQNGTIIEGNIIHRTRCIGQGICSKGVNDIINNIIADLRPSRRPIRPERITRAYLGLVVNPVTGSRIERNILFSRNKEYPVYTQNRIYGTGGEPRLRDCVADRNLYHCTEDPDWGRAHLERERPFGVEIHSVIADPLFEDPAKGDFRLKVRSPALKLGFQPIDMSQIGLRPDHPYHRLQP